MAYTPNFPDSIPRLVGDLVVLRELSEVDVPAWFQRACDPESSALSGDPIPESIDTCFEWLKLHRERFAAQAGIRWAIVPKGAAASVGSIGLTLMDTDECSAEVGAVVARAQWGRGFGTCAARLVIQYAFETLHLARVQADCLQSNLASRRVLEKLGFSFERVLPNYHHSAAGDQAGCLYVLGSRAEGAA